MTTRSIARAMVVLSLAMVSGCPDTTTVSSERCEHVGDPCRLPSGPLGVCSETLPCAAPPCIACTSQH